MRHLTMALRNIFLLTILFGQLLTQNTSIEERKTNEVVKILNKFLDKIVEETTTKNITIPLVDLDQYGKFENVIVSIPKITKWTDGVGNFGFQMNLNVKEIFAAGYYDVKDIDVPKLFPIRGNGNFTVRLDAVDVNLKIKATSNFDTNRFDFSIAVFDVLITSSKLGFENLMEEPNVSDFLNELLGNLIPNFVKAFLPPLSKLLQPLLDHYGNGVIDCIRFEILDLDNCLKKLFEPVVVDILHLLL